MENKEEGMSRRDFEIERLGECCIPSPVKVARGVDDEERVLFHGTHQEVRDILAGGNLLPGFELAGPREMICFNPDTLKCGIVTCGGICPGLNDVIRSIVLSLHYHYGVRTVYGFRYGFEGLVPGVGLPPWELTTEIVEDIHQKGGTILGSSRGPQPVGAMVETLERLGIGILFVIGGDGTLKGARDIAAEISRRKRKIAVMGVPKTIDNDISCTQRTFGFDTAVEVAREIIYTAHTEAHGARNGVGLVKLMGRHSGFIAAHATLSSSDVNFCLIPEVPFALNALLDALKKRLQKRAHAVVVVAEGAGQDLMKETAECDASGNIRLKDIGLFLQEKITACFKDAGVPISLKYFDPSYTIRSVPADAQDSAFCLLLGQMAVQAGMTGRTNMMIGFWRGEFVHVPISLAVSRRKRIDPDGWIWRSVLMTTGQLDLAE